MEKTVIEKIIDSLGSRANWLIFTTVLAGINLCVFSDKMPFIKKELFKDHEFFLGMEIFLTAATIARFLIAIDILHIIQRTPIVADVINFCWRERRYEFASYNNKNTYLYPKNLFYYGRWQALAQTNDIEFWSEDFMKKLWWDIHFYSTNTNKEQIEKKITQILDNEISDNFKQTCDYVEHWSTQERRVCNEPITIDNTVEDSIGLARISRNNSDLAKEKHTKLEKECQEKKEIYVKAWLATLAELDVTIGKYNIITFPMVLHRLLDIEFHGFFFQKLIWRKIKSWWQKIPCFDTPKI